MPLALYLTVIGFARKALAAYIRTYMNYLFLDSNIFLQFKSTAEIKWSDHVIGPHKIVLTTVVIQELDKHKYDPRQRVSNRARNLISQIRPVLSAENHPVYTFFERDALPEDYVALNLSQAVEDDRLLIALHKFKNLQPEATCYLVSDDTMLLFKAKRLGFSTIELSDSERLPAEIDERDRENRQLKQEIHRYQQRIPKLEFVLDNGKGFDRLEMLRPAEAVDDMAIPEKAKEEHEEKDAFKNMALTIPNYGQSKRYNYEKYNKAVRVYNAAVDKYAKDWRDLYNWQKRTLKFTAVLRNTGSMPAENIEVLLHLPEGLEVIDWEDHQGFPKRPDKPRFENFTTMDIIFPAVNADPGFAVPEDVDLDPGRPLIDGNDEINVTYSFSQLKHKKDLSLRPICLTFSDVSAIRNLQIAYEVHADNVLEPLKGVFNLTFV